MAYLFGVLIGVCVVLLISWYVAKQFFEIAKAKGYNDKKYFWICFWLDLPGWLLVIALPVRGNNAPVISDELPDL